VRLRRRRIPGLLHGSQPWAGHVHWGQRGLGGQGEDACRSLVHGQRPVLPEAGRPGFRGHGHRRQRAADQAADACRQWRPSDRSRQSARPQSQRPGDVWKDEGDNRASGRADRHDLPGRLHGGCADAEADDSRVASGQGGHHLHHRTGGRMPRRTDDADAVLLGDGALSTARQNKGLHFRKRSPFSSGYSVCRIQSTVPCRWSFLISPVSTARLSRDSSRLSPITKYSSAPRVTGSVRVPGLVWPMEV